MLRTIENYGEKVIQKVCKPNGTVIRYQAGKPGDAMSMTICSSLSEARASIGIKITPPSILTKPKMDNPQNQKGYKAQTR